MINPNIFMFIDETGLDKESKILGLACIVTSEPLHIRTKLDSLKLDLLKRKRLKDIPSIENLNKKGFHYCEDHQDIRPVVIDLIAKLPFEAYICYRHKRHDFCSSNGFEWYDQLFGKLMHDRLRKYKGKSLSVCFEQHGKSFKDREQKLKEALEQIVHEIELKDAVKFLNLPLPLVKSAGKEEPCLAVADYTAAIFKDYESSLAKLTASEMHSNSSSWQTRHFSMLRPKIRVIHNYATGEFFTRHNPFP